MRLIRTSIQNYRTIRSFELEYDRVGIVHLSGQNGSGKSNLLRAVYWGLTGREPRVKFASRRIIPRHIKCDKTVVTNWIEEDGKTYVIARQQVKNKTTLTVFDENDQPCGPVDLVLQQRWLEESFGVSERQLSQTLLFSSHHFQNVGMFTEFQMSRFLEDAIGYRFDLSVKAAKDLIVKHQRRLGDLAQMRAAVASQIRELAAHADSVFHVCSEHEKDMKADLEYRKRCQTEISRLESQIVPDEDGPESEMRAAFDELGKLLIPNRLEECPKCGHVLKCQLDKKKYAEVKKRREQLESLIEEKKAQLDISARAEAALRPSQATLRRLDEQIATRKERLATLQSTVDELLARVRDCKAKASRYRRSVNWKNGQLQVAMACAQALPEVRREMVSAVREEMNEAMQAVADALTDGDLLLGIDKDTMRLKVEFQTGGGSVEDISEGEAVMVDFSFLLGYRDVCQRMSSTKTPNKVLFIDERFSHLHDFTRAKFLLALGEWTKATGTMVVVVDHAVASNSPLIDFTLTASKSSGISSFEWK